MIFIPKERDRSNKWYSSKDYQRFCQALVRDAVRLSKEMNDTPAKATIPLKTLYECVGLEVRVWCNENGQFERFPYLTKLCTHFSSVLQTFLSLSLARLTYDRKRAHKDAVLLEQRLQEQRSISNVEELSSVSRKSSRWAKMRAAKLARGYSKLFDE